MAINIISEPSITLGFGTVNAIAVYNPIVFIFEATSGEEKIELNVIKFVDDSSIVSGIILDFDKNNQASFDCSPYLSPLLPNQNDNNVVSEGKADVNSSIQFYLQYREFPEVSPGLFTDSNDYFATNSVKQAGDLYGQNMAEYYPAPNNIAKWLTTFKKPVLWRGFPFSIQYLNFSGNVKDITEYDIQGNEVDSSMIDLKDVITFGKSTFVNINSVDNDTVRIDLKMEALISFDTEWNTPLDGNFGQSNRISLDSPQTAKWILPDSTEINSNSLNTNLGGFDGTRKTVFLDNIVDSTRLFLKVIKPLGSIDLSSIQYINANFELTNNATDFAAGYGFDEFIFGDNNTSVRFLMQYQRVIHEDLSGMQFVSNADVFINFNDFLNQITFALTGSIGSFMNLNDNDLLSIDLTGHTFTNTDFQANNNNNLASIVNATGTSSMYQVRNSALITNDLTGLAINNGGSFLCDNSNTMTTLIFDSTSQRLASVFANGNNLNTINFGGLVFDDVCLVLDVSNNSASTASVDNWLQQIDARASVLTVAGSCTIRIGGTNSAPTGGGTNANITSLTVTKKFIVLHS